jgi:redox-sensitive bicupin YhaK (pirin superfamily)
MSKKILHKSTSRGLSNQGWLHSSHTFSFGNYYDSERMHFGVLRVINDDMVAPGKGFGMHPHSNMEIITIPLSGELKHMDDMNHCSIIKKGEVQVMSAGTGLFHSEMNQNADRSVSFLQIWILPKVQKVKPRYQQKEFQLIPNDFTQIISPRLNDDKLWIFQDAWLHMADFSKGNAKTYTLKQPQKNGVYIFVIEGELEIDTEILKSHDGIGFWEIDDIVIVAKENSEFILIEVPMQL